VTVAEVDHAAEWGDQPTMPFFPDHFLSEAVTMLLVLCLYTLLAVFMPATLENVANPLTTPAGIKPEWYFLFLYSFLHFVPPIVGIVVSMGGLVFLMALPFLDRNPSRKPRDRKVAIAMSFVVIAAIVGLSILGLME
jgi:quinol-cytochrome oxidoreductase complex cytochrome b subunit